MHVARYASYFVKNPRRILTFKNDPFYSFLKFQCAIHRDTLGRYDEIVEWTEKAVKQVSAFESQKNYADSTDPVVRQGIELRNKAMQKFKGSLSHLKGLRLLVHVPPFLESPGGASLFGNIVSTLKFLGVEVRELAWGDRTEDVLNAFQPTVLMTSDASSYLSQISWEAISQFRKKSNLHVGLTASLQEYGNSPLPGRLEWAKDHGVDFYYSFRSPEYVKQRYQPFFEAGYNVFTLEFGANPLLHYPVPGIARDLPFVFLASSNRDKWNRYFEYLPELLKKHPGFVDGPGWFFSKRWKTLGQTERDFTEHRFLYARAKVGINLHIDDSILWPSELNERTYALAACGTPQLVDDAMLIGRYFSKDAFFVAKNPKQYLELFERMLQDPKECERRALQAQQEVFERHTTFQRAESFINSIREGLKF